MLCLSGVTGQSFRHAYFNHVLAYKVSADVLAYICACMSKYWMYVASCVYLRLHNMWLPVFVDSTKLRLRGPGICR